MIHPVIDKGRRRGVPARLKEEIAFPIRAPDNK